jgi:hypothetical protein
MGRVPQPARSAASAPPCVPPGNGHCREGPRDGDARQQEQPHAGRQSRRTFPWRSLRRSRMSKASAPSGRVSCAEADSSRPLPRSISSSTLWLASSAPSWPHSLDRSRSMRRGWQVDRGKSRPDRDTLCDTTPSQHRVLGRSMDVYGRSADSRQLTRCHHLHRHRSRSVDLPGRFC